MKKARKWIISILSGVIGLVLVGILVLSCMKPVFYKEFLASAQETVSIPGLDAPYAPQGLAYQEHDGSYLFSGYMTNGESSRLYVVNRDQEVGYVEMPSLEGEEVFTGHVGGIAVVDNHVYVADDGRVYVLDYQEIITQAYQDEKTPLTMTYFEVGTTASFVFASSSTLWVGEFHLKGKYDTSPSHETTLIDGSKHYAWIEGYPLSRGEGFDDSDATAYGLSSLTPDYILTAIDKVQGFAVTTEGRILLSVSWSIYHSYLYIYSNVLTNAPNRTIERDGSAIPVYDLESRYLEKRITMMPMSEDLDYYNGLVYINFESACRKYKMFNLFPQKKVMTYPLA